MRKESKTRRERERKLQIIRPLRKISTCNIFEVILVIAIITDTNN